MDIIKEVRNGIIFNLVCAVEDRVDGADLTRDVGKQLDKQFGFKHSKKIKRGPLTNFLLEMLEGAWDGDKERLNTRIEAWQHSL